MIYVDDWVIDRDKGEKMDEDRNDKAMAMLIPWPTVLKVVLSANAWKTVLISNEKNSKHWKCRNIK